MKILMVIGQFYPTIGGSERQCLLLSKMLRARGHEVSVVTTWDNRLCPQQEEVEGMSVYRVWYPFFQIGSKRVGFGFLAPLIMALHLLRRISDYDVVHAHQCLWPTLAATLAAKLKKKPIVCKLANSGDRFDLLLLKENHLYGSFACSFVVKHVNRFVYTSKAVYDDLISSGVCEERLCNIPNGVSMPVSDQKRYASAISTTHFVFIGTLTKKKNFLSVVNAVASLSEQDRRRTHLTVVGDGPERAAIEDLIDSYHLSSYIELVGEQRDVTPFLRSSEVFILPSYTEGLSNAALEAMAHGLALILSDAGGNKDLIEEKKNGLSIDPTDILSIAKALKYMIDHPKERRRMGEASREKAVRKYSIDMVVEQYERLYRTV